jgi:hypothetical protein
MNHGAYVELFDEALRKIYANIDDVNTEPKAARSITLKLSIKPSADRKTLTIVPDISVKLAAMKKVEHTLFMVRERTGEPAAVEDNSTQDEMFRQ